MPDADDPEPVAIPITGELDLHAFRPGEVTSLLDEYFIECRKRGLQRVRVVHGKGTGALRRQVHALLDRIPEVTAFALASAEAGGWGATLVTLRPKSAE